MADIAYLNTIKDQNNNQISSNLSQIANMQYTISSTAEQLNAQIIILQDTNTQLTNNNLIIDDIIAQLS